MALFDLPLPELERYLPVLDEPEDFDEFWAATLAEARTFDLGLTVSPVDSGLTVIDAFDVTFAGFGGHPIKAWVTRPAGRSGTCPRSSSSSGTAAAAGSRTSGSPGPPPGTCTWSWTRAGRAPPGAAAATRPTRQAPDRRRRA